MTDEELDAIADRAWDHDSASAYCDIKDLVAEVRWLRAQYHAAKRGEWHCGDSACGVCNDLDR